MAVFEAFGFKLGFYFENLRLGGRKCLVEPTEDGERKNDVLIFVFCDSSMEVLSDFPQEAGDAADILVVVGHGG